MKIEDIDSQEQYERRRADIALLDEAIQQHISGGEMDVPLDPALQWKALLDGLQSVRDEIEERMIEWEQKK